MCVGLSLGISTPRIRGIPTAPSLLSTPQDRGLAGLKLSLALLVAGIGANYIEAAAPTDQLAVLADKLDAGPHLHCPPPPMAPNRQKTESKSICADARTRKGETAAWRRVVQIRCFDQRMDRAARMARRFLLRPLRIPRGFSAAQETPDRQIGHARGRNQALTKSELCDLV